MIIRPDLADGPQTAVSAELSGDSSGPTIPAPGAATDHSTRQRILTFIVEHAPVTVAELAEALALTPPGVRRHLDALLAQDLIEASETAPPRRGRGRPARAYILSAAGQRAMSNRYDDVATAALRFLTEQVGPEAVAEFAHRRLAEFEQRYASIVDAAGPDVMARASALAQALADDGYAASARPVPLPLVAVSAHTGDGVARRGGVQLCQGHCPMHSVAAEFPQFCEAETDLFARLLGVHVQRLATLAGGEHVCTTFVPDVPASGELVPHVRDVPKSLNVPKSRDLPKVPERTIS